MLNPEFYQTKIHEKWLSQYESFFLGEDTKDAFNLIVKDAKQFQIYPRSLDMFNAFKYDPNDVKIVILGQDPYHNFINGKAVAHGLAFSYKKASDIDAYEPPSLRNILREVETDIYDGMQLVPGDTNLTRWAEQGVLLLNTALTVRAGQAGSHTNIWKKPIRNFIEEFSKNNPHLIWMLWGNHAKGFKDIITPGHILESGHPSPLSANKGLWFGNKHFSKANKIIESQNGKDYIIKW